MCPQIIPGNPDNLEAEMKANSRPEPKLQPMRIVQVPETEIPLSASASTRTASELHETSDSKKLVLSKKEHEAIQLAKAGKSKKFEKIPYIPPTPEQQELLNKVMTNEQRNMRRINNTNETVLPDFPEEWGKADYKRVYRAWTQTPLSLSGLLSSESTFTPEKFLGRLVMGADHSMLYIRIWDSTSNVMEIGTPLANVKLLVFKERQ